MAQGHVVTVLGPRDAGSLGVIDAHDHLLMDSPGMPGLGFTDPARSIEEVLEGKATGISTIVEMTPIGLGRDPAGLRTIAEATGVTVIGASGFHRDAHYPAGSWVHDATVETLTDRVLADLREGMHPRDWTDPGLPLDQARAGAIKGGASYHRITRSERKRLEAIGAASAATGAAVLVHTEIGTAAHDIVDLLESVGARPDRIALAHLDRNPDWELHAEVAARGVTLEYDTVGRTKYHPDSVVLDLIERVAGAGHLDRIVLGLDLGSKDYLRAYDGGPGLRYLMRAFAPRLRRRLGEDATARILVANPARLYAFPGRVSGMIDRYDVIVVGAGSAGASAAISAARLGASTLLVDRLAFMGGTSTAVLDTFYAFYTPGEQPRRVVGGLGWEVARRLAAQGVAFERPNTYGAGTGVTYDAEALKVVWERLAEDAGVDLLLHTWVTGVRVDDGAVTAIRLWNKGGARWVEGTVVVDASGDADVSAMAGVPHDAPGDGGPIQSLSTLFKVANVDIDAASAVKKAELWARMAEAAASGAYALPRIEGSWHRTPYEGVALIHMTRIPNVDATDPVQLTRAEVEGRRQVQEYHRFLRDRVPGFERSVIVATSPAIGVRESRRVHGDHRLTREEVLGGVRFDDEIALCGAPIEDHGAGGDTAWLYIGAGGVYGVPYRSLLPLGVEGLLVAGRCFSSTHDAHASARSMATCMAMGQAAGTAAVMAAAGGTVPRAVPAGLLRERLALDGVLLEPVEAGDGVLASSGRP